MDIAKALDQIAGQIWSKIDQCEKWGISWDEDALTIDLLLAIRTLIPGSLIGFDTRAWESYIGCDFELWIGNNTEGWAAYAVQAKRITTTNGRYPSLKHANAFGRQIDLLKHYASLIDAKPIYALYNCKTPYASNLCANSYSLTDIGCTVTSADVVEEALAIHGARNFGWIHKKSETRLLRCLTCCTPACHHRASLHPMHVHRTLPQHVFNLVSRGSHDPPIDVDRYERRLKAKAVAVIPTVVS